MTNNADLVNSWADSFYQFMTSSWFPTTTHSSADSGGDEARLGVVGGGFERDGAKLKGSCEEWLEKEDSVVYSRDFETEPIFVTGSEQGWKSCAVGYVPVGYFSWAAYDIMAPVQLKTEGAMAAAFISNCDAHNFRLQALEGLERTYIMIDSYGSCHQNHDGRVDKVETLKHYKFSLAFENSNEEDYVTEKFFQSLVAGSVPVVVGAPNIQDFAPSPGSLLHIKELKDVDSVAKKMKWKFEGPSDSFKALVDMAAVHSSCRLCIYLETKIREEEEKNTQFKKRPCKCIRGLETVYHVYMHERGKFEMESIFLRSSNLTLEAFESAVLWKFESINHVPVWKHERPEKIRGDELKVYRIYPVGMTQRQALYTFRFNGNMEFRNHIESNACPKFEFIFV